MSLIAQIGNTPLVPLLRIGAGLPAPIWVKCEHLNPAGSVKDRLALALVTDAESRGLIRPGSTLVEATAGNTGLGLAIMAAIRGYHLVCVMPEKMSHDKRAALTAAGAELVITPNAPWGTPDNFQTVARRLAADNGWFLTDQFESPANPRIHEETTGPEILRDCPELSAFVAGAGTGGTLTGVGRFLRAHRPSAQVVLADPIGSGLAGWVRDGQMGPDSPYLVEGIGSSRCPGNFDRSVIHRAESVSDADSFAMARRLHREEGLLVGGSSGTALVAALRISARSPPGTGPIVVLAADSWDRYGSREWMLAPPAT